MTRDETTRNDIIYEQLKFYFDKDTSVHIKLLSGDWYNCKITSLPESKDRAVINEEVYGELLLIFDRIKDDGIAPRREKE